jgi:hypothetical protein
MRLTRFSTQSNRPFAGSITSFADGKTKNKTTMKTPILFNAVTKTIPVADLVPGPILHKRLSPDLEERIRKLEPVLAEVYPISHQEWLEGFQRDLNPESEVKVFEAIASAYQGFLAKQALILPAKKEAYALLVTSGGTMEETLARAKLRHLSRKEADELLRLYAAALAKNQ